MQEDAAAVVDNELQIAMQNHGPNPFGSEMVAGRCIGTIANRILKKNQ
jgi:hypothetical protein